MASDEAVEGYQRAVELSPKENDAWTALAEAYEALGQDAEAAAARATELRRLDDAEMSVSTVLEHPEHSGKGGVDK